ncbi:MAG TPA: flagellar export chaperone FliS [Acidobacteriaceae bacterium]|jgi:flagellar protein FliS|nr:flagellar export chaperone FliS [Acidobacteriaceae bacterium]
MASYQEHALDGASPVELVVALYDGILRFLHTAIAAVERGDVEGRRAAVKRALAIVIHLQARLRMDIGGRPAQVLSEYYASMFALIVQASLAASAERFEEVIGCIRNVRDAWRQVAQDPTAQLPPMQAKGIAAQTGGKPGPRLAPPPAAESEPTRWTA